MNSRIILFIICSFLLVSCSEQQKPERAPPQVTEEQAKPEEKEVTERTASNPVSNQPASIDANSFKIDMMDFVVGNRDAKVVLMEYSSPTCPHCSYFHKKILPVLKEKYFDTGKVVYVLREFVANKQDLDAALMGRCYKNDEDPLKLLNLLYIQQDSWAFNKNYREIITNMGGLAGVSREEYMQCLSDKNVIDFLLKQAKIISSYPGFIGTPAFLINGVMYKGAYSVEGLSKAIDERLKFYENEGSKESE